MRIIQYVADVVRARETDKAVEKCQIPLWWDFDVDCGYSDKWYRCRKCDVCTRERWVPIHSDM